MTGLRAVQSGAQLQRATFRTSRLLDFCSRKELIAQTGHRPEDWPLVVLKELIDNALDACEEAGVAPTIEVRIDGDGITVSDNGPGIPPDTIEGVLDFSIRVSSREAYVAPDRGAQGNALKTIVAMLFVLDGERGFIEVAAGVRHRITFTVDAIRQEPVINHDQIPDNRVICTAWRPFERNTLRGFVDLWLRAGTAAPRTAATTPLWRLRQPRPPVAFHKLWNERNEP